MNAPVASSAVRVPILIIAMGTPATTPRALLARMQWLGIQVVPRLIVAVSMRAWYHG